MLQRNEIDVVLFNVIHHLDVIGFDRFLVGDNGSTDGSREALRRLEKQDPRLLVMDMPGSYDQAARVNALYQIAVDSGADWIVPLDADEFIALKPGQLKRLLSASSELAVHMKVRNFAQRRSARRKRMHALATMCYFVPPKATLQEAMDFVIGGKIAFVESVYPPKYIWRSDKSLVINKGNHGANKQISDIRLSIDLNHVPLRSYGALVEREKRISRLEDGIVEQSWHIKRLASVDMDDEWMRNSFTNGHLDVKGNRHPLTFDPFFIKVFIKHAIRIRALVKA